MKEWYKSKTIVLNVGAILVYIMTTGILSPSTAAIFTGLAVPAVNIYLRWQGHDTIVWKLPKSEDEKE